LAYRHTPPESAEDLAYWCGRERKNVCIICGLRPYSIAVVVADIDPRHDGELDTLWQMGWVQETPIAVSGSGGWHVYAACPADDLASVDTYATGIELKARGKLVVMPPSRHMSGQRYRWLEGHEPWNVPVAAMPGAVISEIRSRTPVAVEQEPVILTEKQRKGLAKKAPGLVDTYVARAKTGVDGGHYNTMRHLGFQLWSLGISVEELQYWLFDYQQKAGWWS